MQCGHVIWAGGHAVLLGGSVLPTSDLGWPKQEWEMRKWGMRKWGNEEMRNEEMGKWRNEEVEMCVCAELVYNFLISSLYKAIYGQTYFYPRIFVPRSSPYLSSGNFNFNLIRSFAHTNYADCTFIPNVIMHWNNLPNSVKSSSSDRFLYLKFLCINTYLLKTYCLMFVLV